MIRVERPEDVPQVLLQDGVVEQDEAHQLWVEYSAKLAQAQANGGKLPKKPSLKFAKYKDDDVKHLLEAVFHGKCAYCESFYSSTQPMDVEHYRPKGAVAEENDHSGYYWLAATWENLLPSCIDCNRKRGQQDVFEETTRSLGKKDRFPISGTRAMTPSDSLPSERPRLVNPCDEDPDEMFVFDSQLAVVVPRAQSGIKRGRALDSIEVYGLNRSGLVTDRLHVLRMIDHHLEVIRLLTQVRDQLDEIDLEELSAIVDDVISLEIRQILKMRDPDQPYAGLARQVIEDLAPSLA